MSDDAQALVAALGEIVPIESVKVLTVQPGDILVFQVSERLNMDQAQRFKEVVRAATSLRALILDRAELAAILRGEPA